ncbi:MAG: hypothetical protein L6R38_007939 [Xanthoria sp. 2 TBL-2021]|nr:MAG: hypothetical protein L6R38_007939 [Xanthoria sp. 2 TBL-2021]
MKNMTPEQLERCIALGKAIADGREDLADLDAISLGLRGKKQKPAADRKRKRAAMSPINAEEKLPKKRQLSIKSALSTPNPRINPRPSPALTSTPLVPPDTERLKTLRTDLTTLVTTSNLSSFRQRVLLALCQVPRGRFTTYAAISDHLHSSARAVGTGLRNNPFAPIAADRSLGGFGGFWGKEGKFAGEKVRLLREEGIIVDVGKGRVEEHDPTAHLLDPDRAARIG